MATGRGLQQRLNSARGSDLAIVVKVWRKRHGYA